MFVVFGDHFEFHVRRTFPLRQLVSINVCVR